MKKNLVQNTQKKHRIKISAKPAVSHEYKEQLREMSDEELVHHRRELMRGRDGLSSEYWNRMWSVNAEMAMRFSKMIKEAK